MERSFARREARVAALAVCLAFGAVGEPRSASAEGDSVSLRFAWPSPMVLRVERTFERTETRPDGSTPPSITSAVRYVWRGAKSGPRYALAFSDFEVVRPELEPKSGDPLVRVEHASRALEALLPTIVADDAGQPIDLEGLAALRDRSAAQYRAIPGLSGDPAAQRMVDVLTSDAMLTQRSLEDWNRMVQVWNGTIEALGTTREIEGETGAAAGAPIRNIFSYTIERRLPCRDEGDRGSCVRVVQRQFPRFDDAREATKVLLGFDFVSAFGAPADATFAMENTFVTDTHPETLVPVRATKTKRWSVSWNDASGAPRVVGRTDRWDYTFTPIE